MKTKQTGRELSGRRQRAGFLTLSLAPFLGSNTASLEFADTGMDSLYERCSGHFDAVWERSGAGA